MLPEPKQMAVLPRRSRRRPRRRRRSLSIAACPQRALADHFAQSAARPGKQAWSYAWISSDRAGDPCLARGPSPSAGPGHGAGRPRPPCYAPLHRVQRRHRRSEPRRGQAGRTGRRAASESSASRPGECRNTRRCRDSGETQATRNRDRRPGPATTASRPSPVQAWNQRS